MIKRLCLAFAGLFAFVSIASGAGTIPGFSLTPQFNLSGTVAPGCKLYIIQAGTTSTPQNAYQDSALTLLQPNPMICDAGGRLGQFFVADGTIKLRLTDRNGVQLFVGDNLVVVGASSGGGGGGTVDPTTIIQTGQLIPMYGTGVLSGFVRANGRTIGSATSGATERANADTSALFSFLWSADANLAVSGGRGASSAADFAANKTIALPDMRGLALAGLDGMGNSARGVFTGATFSSGSADVLGSALGASRRTLTAAQLPSSIPYTDPGHTHSASWEMGTGVATGDFPPRGITNTGVFRSVTVLSSTTGITINPSGGQAHDTISPYVLVTLYLKL